MKAKLINTNLFIQRGPNLIPQYCPFSSQEMRKTCGGWCPLFGDIVKLAGENNDFSLNLCAKSITFELYDIATDALKTYPDGGFDVQITDQ